MITVTLYGRAHYTGTVWADDNIFITEIPDPDFTTVASVPDNTRLLSVWVSGHSNDHPGFSEHDQPGILIMLSNGFVTGPKWKCSIDYSPYDSHEGPDFNELAFDDSDWPQAVVHTWPRDEHFLYNAEYISGEQTDGELYLHCRGWVSKYIKLEDYVKWWTRHTFLYFTWSKLGFYGQLLTS